MEAIDLAACDNVGGGFTPWGAISIASWGFSVGQALYNATGYLGGTLRNYYGEDTALEAFRGGNLGA